jgi:hypothetical protein
LCRRCHMLGDGRMKNLKQFANPSWLTGPIITPT